MTAEELSRTEALLGGAGIEKLKSSRVAVFGLGGVGGHCAEALVRSGVGFVDLIDGDRVTLSNINRQLIALHSTVGKLKTDVCAERFSDISPDAEIRKFPVFFSEKTAGDFDLSQYDYVADCVDDVKAKALLAEICFKLNVNIISSMGAGNKLDPTRFRVADIYKTSVCPLARVMRHELKKRGVERLKVVYSDEEPVLRGRVPASCAFVPSAAGLVMAGEVVRGLISDIKEV